MLLITSKFNYTMRITTLVSILHHEIAKLLWRGHMLLRAKHMLQEGEYIGSMHQTMFDGLGKEDKANRIIDYFRTRSRMFNFSN